MATRKPATYHCAATRWSLDDLVAALEQHRPWGMSRSSIWRMLDEADLTPPRRVYGLHSHDPDFEPKAHAMGSLYLHARRFFAHARLVICTDEKTGMQMLQRKSPTPPMAPGKPEKREHEDIRHGGRALIASLGVATGQVVWHLGQTRTRVDFAAHLAHGVHPLPAMQRSDWVVDNLNTPWSLDVCRLVAQGCGVPFVALSGVPAVLEQKTSLRCKYVCYRHMYGHAPPVRSDPGDRSPVVEPSRTSLSGSPEGPQTLAAPCLINRKIVFAEGVEVFEACWRERGQVCLVHGISLSA
jgi:hypothetical protein